MEQLNLFDYQTPYKYIIDTCAILSQKEDRQYRRRIYEKLWKNIDNLVKESVIVTCSEIFEEISDEPIQKWLKDCNCTILQIDELIQKNVTTVVTSNPQLIDFKQLKSSGDAFLIATAMKYSLTVITEENKDSNKKIPYVCKNLGVPCVNILELCELEQWTF